MSDRGRAKDRDARTSTSTRTPSTTAIKRKRSILRTPFSCVYDKNGKRVPKEIHAHAHAHPYHHHTLAPTHSFISHHSSSYPSFTSEPDSQVEPLTSIHRSRSKKSVKMSRKIDKENTPVESTLDASDYMDNKSQSMPSLPLKGSKDSRRPRKALSKVNLNQSKMHSFSKPDLSHSRIKLTSLARVRDNRTDLAEALPDSSSSSYLELDSPLNALGDPVKSKVAIRSTLTTPQQPSPLHVQSDVMGTINTTSHHGNENEPQNTKFVKYASKQVKPDPLCLKLASQYHLEAILKSRPWVYQSMDTFYDHLESEGLLKMDLLLELTKYKQLATINLSHSFAIRSSPELPFLKTNPLDSDTLLSITKPFYHHVKAFSPCLKALDLTNIPLNDESIRYLIRLEGLTALGLSGSALTTQGMKYLATHAAFKSTLQCLKLCFAEHLSNDCLPYICQFSRLTELDLWGTKLSLEGLLDLVTYDASSKMVVAKLPLKSLRVSDAVFSALLGHHASYQFRHSPALLPMVQLAQDPSQVSSLGRSDIVEQLKVHQLFYPDIFLNLKTEELAAKLEQILIVRLKEEKLWSLL